MAKNSQININRCEQSIFTPLMVMSIYRHNYIYNWVYWLYWCVAWKHMSISLCKYSATWRFRYIAFTLKEDSMPRNQNYLSSLLSKYLFLFVKLTYSKIYVSLQYAVFLALLLLAEMTAGILFFVFKDWVSIFYLSAIIDCLDLHG